MPAELDPLSQLIGGLSAQIAGLSTQIVELRSDVVTNRNAAQTRNEDLARKLDLVQAEYRNVKHLERTIETSSIAIDERLKLVNANFSELRNETDERLRTLEDQILVWRAKLAILLTTAGIFGSLIGFAIQLAFKRLTG